MKIILLILAVIAIAAACFAGELYSQLARYRVYWQRNNQQPIRKDSLVYVALGDSAAQGVGANKPQNGYVGLIGRELEARSGKEVQIINLSKSGALVRHVIETQLPAFESLGMSKDPIITIEIGANDMLDFEPGKFEREMDELMSKLPKQAIISDIPYFGGSRLAGREPNVEKANEIMYRLAKKHEFELANLHARVKASHGIRTFAADWFHPSTYAYKTNWAPAFLEQINIKQRQN